LQVESPKKIVTMNRKARKREKRTQVAKIRYRTQCLKIGEIKCLFLSWWDYGRSPFITLGPSWPYTIFLLVLGIMIFIYFIIMLKMAAIENTMYRIVTYTGITINIIMLFGGILKNPGMN